MALLLVKVSKWVRLLLMSGLVLVWAMPPVVAVQVWYWMTNFENGVLTYVLAKLHLVGESHDWYATPFSQLSMVTLLIVWGALPFVVITVYAALAQVPDELVVKFLAHSTRRQPHSGERLPTSSRSNPRSCSASAALTSST